MPALAYIQSFCTPVMKTGTTNKLFIPLPNRTLPGNALFVGLTWSLVSPAATITSIIDDQGSTGWTLGPTANDTVAGQTIQLAYVSNVLPSATLLTIQFSGTVALTFVQAHVIEMCGLATSSMNDGAGIAFNGNSTAWDATGFPNTVSDGDVIFYFAVTTGGLVTLFTPMTNGHLIGAQPTDTQQAVSQYITQTTHGAITPTCTATGGAQYLVAAQAFKTDATKGTMYSGGRILRVQHQNAQPPPASWKPQFPCSGNLQVVMSSTGTNTLTAFDDSLHNAWQRCPSSPLVSGDSTVTNTAWFSLNSDASDTLVLTITVTVGNGADLIFYDIVGGALLPFDLSAAATGNQTGGSGVDFSTVPIKPKGGNEVVLFVGDQTSDAITGMTGAGYYFDEPHWDGQHVTDAGMGAAGTLDAQAGHYYTTDDRLLLPTWQHVGTAVSNWDGIAVAFFLSGPRSGKLPATGGRVASVLQGITD